MNRWESGFFQWLIEWLHPKHGSNYPCIHVGWGPVQQKDPPKESEAKHV